MNDRDYDPIASGDIGKCEGCGKLVVLVRFKDGLVMTIDPPARMRRVITVLLGPAFVAAHGFGPGLGTSHECPSSLSPLERKGLYAGEHLDN